MKKNDRFSHYVIYLTTCNSGEKEKQEPKEEVEIGIIPKAKWEVKKEHDEFIKQFDSS